MGKHWQGGSPTALRLLREKTIVRLTNFAARKAGTVLPFRISSRGKTVVVTHLRKHCPFCARVAPRPTTVISIPAETTLASQRHIPKAFKYFTAIVLFVYSKSRAVDWECQGPLSPTFKAPAAPPGAPLEAMVATLNSFTPYIYRGKWSGHCEEAVDVAISEEGLWSQCLGDVEG